MKRPFRLTLAGLVLAGLASCSPPPATAPGPVPTAATRSYSLRGEVIEVNADTGIVSIRHEDIPGFMPAMTMPFDLSGQAVLQELLVGDTVEGTLRVGDGKSELVDLKVAVRVEDRALVLDTTGPNPTLRERRPILKVGEAVPDFSFTMQDGTTRALSDFRGEVVVLTFIYTRCPLPDFCPRMDQRFKELATMIEPDRRRAAKVRLLSMSFDPEHDTPEVLSRHAKLRGANPPLWSFAVASHEELARVAERLGLTYGPTPNEIIHNLTTAVIAPDGTLARLEAGNGWAAADLLRTIAELAPRD